MKKKKINAYLKTILWMLLGAIAGGMIGILFVRFYQNGGSKVTEGGAALFSGLQQAAFPVLILIMLLTVAYGESNLKKQKKIGEKVLETEDEECDYWEYELEKIGARGTIVNTISQILSVLALSVCYSMDYISSGYAKNVLDYWEYELEKIGARGTIVNTISQILSVLALSVCYSMDYISSGYAKNVLFVSAAFVVVIFYDSCWQIRFVKHTQKIYPQMKADVSSRNFNQQWLECCDEAEKEYIYQSAYKCYQQLGKAVPSLLFVALLGHLFFDGKRVHLSECI